MKDEKTQSQISMLLSRHKSTIIRDLVRNAGNRGYRPKQACLLAEERSLGSRNASRITATDWGKAVDCVFEQWSPVQIANQVVGISHETIYRHVYADKTAGDSLYQQLRCQKKRKKRYASGRERSQHIEARSQVGHWEGDTVIGTAHQQAIVTLVGRKSGHALIAKVSNKTLDLVSQVVVTKLNSVTPLVKTLIFDNGKEFSENARIDKALKSTTYFADPFTSWQRRGSNENFNGLLRQYIPKKRPLSTVTDRELRMTQEELNNHPRKRLGFKTPNEGFMQS
jgi:IS30 family transposase